MKVLMVNCCISQRGDRSRTLALLASYSAALAEKVDGALFFPTFSELETALRRIAQPGDIILTVGAGDVYKIGENITK